MSRLSEIPFVMSSGDKNRCVEASMNSVLKYFFPERNFSLDDLDFLVDRKSEKWTYTHQIVPALYNLGLKVKFFSVDSLENFMNEKSFMNFLKITFKTYENMKFVLQNTDVESVVRTAKKCSKYDLFEQRKLNFQEIEKLMEKGNIPLMLLDKQILEGKNEPYFGHFVVVTGFDDDTISYHENSEISPKSNKKISKEKFVKAWNSPGTGNDVVIVYGKK